jgi:hypothetical protein
VVVVIVVVPRLAREPGVPAEAEAQIDMRAM